MADSRYDNFCVAIYTRAYEVNKMSDFSYLTDNFDIIARQVKVSKVYLETHRDMVIADEAVIGRAKEYLESRGVKVSGGITITVNERNHFETYCYTNPDHRRKLQEVVAYTARLFDEFILDDFFFTNCKCPSCIAAKGDRSWTDFRLELMTEAASELILGPARAANPYVKVTVKYPNWYERFQGRGFNLETQPTMFDYIYSGTETREPVTDSAHLQPYESYQIYRYFENIKPGGNMGGWVDPGGFVYLDRYVEQLWHTLFAKAPEITLFDFRGIQQPIRLDQRAPWQGGHTSFDFDATVTGYWQPDGAVSPDARLSLAAGSALDTADRFLGELGRPVGVACYKPFHSLGEAFLHDYLGMIGIPIDLHPAFPAEAQTVLLTESASFDRDIVTKIKGQLMDGKVVIITSGLLRALQGKGIEDLVEFQTSDRKVTASDFLMGRGHIYRSEQPVTVPQITYLTNDWELVSCSSGVTGTSLLSAGRYGNGWYYVLNVPDSYGDLYGLPQEVLSLIRRILTQDLYVRVDAPSQVMLFAYDNDAFIVHSLRPDATEVDLVVDHRFSGLRDLVSGEELALDVAVSDERGNQTAKRSCLLTLKPHSFRVFKAT
jgi:hypothetical protein